MLWAALVFGAVLIAIATERSGLEFYSRAARVAGPTDERSRTVMPSRRR